MHSRREGSLMTSDRMKTVKLLYLAQLVEHAKRVAELAAHIEQSTDYQSMPDGFEWPKDTDGEQLSPEAARITVGRLRLPDLQEMETQLQHISNQLEGVYEW